MATAAGHRWQFAARFRRNAFGWRSQPAIARVREAVAEIRKVRRSDAVRAAEGAVLFLEKLSPALEHVDSSSGAIGNAVNRAIEELVPVITTAPADLARRSLWLERLWEAYTTEQIPYIETLGDFWGELCAGRELASGWADALIDGLRENWSVTNPATTSTAHRSASHRYWRRDATTSCWSCSTRRHSFDGATGALESGPWRQWASRPRPSPMPRLHADSTTAPTPLPASARSFCSLWGRPRRPTSAMQSPQTKAPHTLQPTGRLYGKYPDKAPAEILRNLIQRMPGDEGKWFATAKDAGLLDLAIELANRSPSDPRTLARAARDFADKNPAFALEAGLAALRWLGQGYGYEVTSADVWATYAQTMQVAERLGSRDEIHTRVRELAANGGFVADVLRRELGLGGQPGISKKT